MPAPPPLYKTPSPKNPTKLFPGFVFGWPFTYEDQVEWANKYNILPDEKEFTRVQYAWKKIASILPPEARRITVVRYYQNGRPITASCIYIGTNVSWGQVAKAQNQDLIQRVWDLLETDVEPQWLLRTV